VQGLDVAYQDRSDAVSCGQEPRHPGSPSRGCFSARARGGVFGWLALATHALKLLREGDKPELGERRFRIAGTWGEANRPLTAGWPRPYGNRKHRPTPTMPARMAIDLTQMGRFVFKRLPPRSVDRGAQQEADRRRPLSLNRTGVWCE
jgi:hypothetical protein